MSTAADLLPTLPALVVEPGSTTRAIAVNIFTTGTTSGSSTSHDLPRLPRWLHSVAEFGAKDHLAGAPGVAALKANVLRVLRREGVETGDVDRVVMLGQARVLGHTFDPMTAFWCGSLRCSSRCTTPMAGGTPTVHPDAVGRAVTRKDFHVSPFNDVEGDYAIRLHLTPQRVGVAIRLLGDEPLVTHRSPAHPGAATAPRGAHGGAAPADDAAGERPDPGARHLALAAPPACSGDPVPSLEQCEMTAETPRLQRARRWASPVR